MVCCRARVDRFIRWLARCNTTGSLFARQPQYALSEGRCPSVSYPDRLNRPTPKSLHVLRLRFRAWQQTPQGHELLIISLTRTAKAQIRRVRALHHLVDGERFIAHQSIPGLLPEVHGGEYCFSGKLVPANQPVAGVRYRPLPRPIHKTSFAAKRVDEKRSGRYRERRPPAGARITWKWQN